METKADRARFTVLQSVRCLDCAKVYAKPVGGGTVWANPGCPHCGYIGWIPLTVPLTEESTPARFGEGRLQSRLAPSG